ncbi:cadherin-like protein 26 [Salmo salar]|uniref:Cadherin-like protein 26 n=1 Tax=Salmo salar TaxID=8030 RepID=A0A1S3MCN9_SALSA|nr:cadherin-like protein 26 [Salmo salar]|eukprot:XP_014000947.1 PREDICTED: cadherin-like protein 26 [Salmo salar]
MAKVSFLLLKVSMMVALALAHDTGNYTLNKREKRELLLRSKRRWVLSTIELVEEDPGPFPKFATQMFNDKTALFKSHQFRLSGTGVNEEPVGVFSIDDNDGVVYVHKPIDRETYPFFHIMFDIIDKVTGKSVDKTLAFDVAITDINDNAPYFANPVMKASVKENMPEGYLPVPLTAMDMDQVNTQNSNISIRLLSQEPAEPKIKLKQVEGTKMSQLTFTGCFDYDKVKMYKVVVEAQDHGIPALSSTAVVNLHIMDSNTHQPVFKNKTYDTHIMEMESNKEILRVAVTDADTPNTPAWRAVYSIVMGNEEGNYKIETDPKTNEGILTVIKGKDFEKTTLTNVQISVENEEPLFVCSSGGAMSHAKTLTPQTVNVTVKVIDVNDPPVFDNKVTDVYGKEEQEVGKVLYKPKVTDVDSDMDKIRYELAEDPAGWFTIDPKTGEVTTVKKMDRESPYVNKDNIYTILIQAIDNGEPPATATGTILVHLGDINDNTPYVVEKKLVMCGNKVIVPVADKDNPPFGCPCFLSLREDNRDKALKSHWKLDPATGMEAGLVSLKSLPYGNYTVPLVIQDQQGMVVNDTVQVMVCDCGGGDKCRASLPRTSSLGLAAIGLLLAGLLLLLLLLLFLLLCECGGKTFTHLPLNPQDEGNQTLIHYNEEGGSSACKGEPMLILTRTTPNHVAVKVVDGMKQATTGIKLTQETNEMTQETNEMYRTTGRTVVTKLSSSGGGGFSGWGTFQRMSEANGTLRSQDGQSKYQTWTTSRNNTMRSNSSKYSRSFGLLSDQHISEHIDRRLNMIGDEVDYQPYEYRYEGRGSKCQSLDDLSLSNLGDDLNFLGDLGPKFNTLGGIFRQDM